MTKTLVVYHSRSGYTRRVAMNIAAQGVRITTTAKGTEPNPIAPRANPPAPMPVNNA